MQEASKAHRRRQQDLRFHRWIKGRVIDIGCGDDAVSPAWYPGITEIVPWDQEQGDAQTMYGVLDESFDCVHSSHCLEDIPDPALALHHWMRILKPGGFLVVTVPDEDLFEQGVWPSTWNPYHKVTFTIYKPNSWSPVSQNLATLIQQLHGNVKLIQVLDQEYDYDADRKDQTLGPAECAIEFVVQKWMSS